MRQDSLILPPSHIHEKAVILNIGQLVCATLRLNKILIKRCCAGTTKVNEKSHWVGTENSTFEWK